MISINFFYKFNWTAYASGQQEEYKISPELMESLEEIRSSNWPAEITKNISFDIYWSNNEYSGIHNYLDNGNHIQNRYSGYLKIDVSALEADMLALQLKQEQSDINLRSTRE
jgi:hypothetical protein